MIKKILIYDTGTLPKGKTVKEMLKEYKEQNVVIWCSSAAHNFAGRNLEGSKPVIIEI